MWSHNEAAAADGGENVGKSEFVAKLHDSDGGGLSEYEGSNYNGYDSPNG